MTFGSTSLVLLPGIYVQAVMLLLLFNACHWRQMRPVMIIDDDADVRDVLTFALENDGYQVIPYQNAKEALEKISRTKDTQLPCLIIVDYLMPEMDGATFIKKLHSRFPESYGEVPVALTSALSSLDPVIKPSEKVFHLHKPMDLDDLLALVRQHCPSDTASSGSL